MQKRWYIVIVIVTFLLAYGLVAPVKSAVDGFALDVLGPSVYNGIMATGYGIVGTIGLGGFAAIIGTSCFIVGVVTKHYWTKADWSLRRKFAGRTSRDLGTGIQGTIATTPSGATIRPVPAPVPTPAPAPAPVTETPAPTPEEKPEEAET